MAAVFNPRDPAVIADPYPAFAELRRADPVHWCEALSGWMLTRYDHVKAAQTDKHLSADRVTPFAEHMAAQGRHREATLGRLLADWAVFADPPKHTMLRRLMVDAFTPRAIEALRPNIREIIATLLARVSGHDRFDLIGEFAYPLPASVIAHILGVPPKDIEQFRGWSDDLATVVGSARLTEGRYERGYRALCELTAYFQRITRERRGSGAEGALIDHLIAARDADGQLSEAELIANCVLLMFAGHETTTNLIGNGMIALLQNPDQLDRLRADSGLIPSAIEEMLRYESPAQTGTRIALEDLDIGGQKITKGERVFLFLNAANRDPEVFEDPDKFDIARSPNRHISFGYGIHFCIGAQLARVEGQMAVAALIDRFPDLALADPVLDWDDSLVLRGVRTLPVLPKAVVAA